jgi:hypothetical protein
MSTLEVAATHWSWWRSRQRRARLRTRPLLAPATGGRHRLPGLAADTVLHEAPDPYRRLFGLVLVPSTGHVSSTLELSLAPSTADDAWIGDLGDWLALLSGTPRLAGCAVSVQQVSSGQQARTRGGQARIRVLIQPTWRTAGLPGRADPAALAVEVGRRLPRLVQSLDRCGVGTARPLAAREIAAAVRTAYRPAVEAGGGRPGAAGSVGGRQPWTDAAPADHAERWDHLRHEGAASLTWSMSRVPSSVVLTSVLTQLSAVPPEVALTRVTLLLEPDGATAEDPCGDLPRLTSLLTITTPHGSDELAAAAATVLDRLPTPLRPWLRPLYGTQAAAFAAGLPSGTLLSAHAAPAGLLTGAE